METKADTKKQQKGKSGEVTGKKPKSSRNSEKRRERSKVAARCRRGKESEIFTELSLSLPVLESTKPGFDKASVMRLTLCDLKLKEMIESVDGFKPVPGCTQVDQDDSFDSLINNAVYGFVLVCSLDGDVVYISEGITTCLGISQNEVMGLSLLEYSHPCDHAEVKEMLLSTASNKSCSLPVVESRSALFRMKSANSTRGRNVHHRSTNYKVVSCIGRIFSGKVVSGKGTVEEKKWFVGVCEPLLHPSDVDIPLNKQTFLSKHTPDMKFEYVDESIAEFMGYKTDDMVGKSLFDFYHACDGEGISRSFKSLYAKGQTVTDRTRFLAKGGGWIWVVTQATTINNNAGKPTSVVCIHFVTSGVEFEEEIVSHVQLRSANEPVISVRKPVTAVPVPVVVPVVPVVPMPEVVEKKPLQETTNLLKSVAVVAPVIPPKELITVEPLVGNPIPGAILSKPTPSTSKIFAPRTEDMDSGFLMPVNDTLIITKEEPDDLTHLAPIAGDECVQICNVPLLDDLLQWLDAADMEYSVLDDYEEPLPIPLIAAAAGGSIIDSPIPIPVNMSTSEICPIVKNDVDFNNLSVNSENSCDSPLLLRNSDPTLLSTTDPLLLSPFKAASPEPISPESSPPSSSRMDFMSSDIFSTFYSDNHGGSQTGGRGGTAGASSHKSKAGGGYDDEPFSGFPIVSDFQETLFSPSGCIDEIGPPSSPPHLINLIHGRTTGLESLKIDVGCSASSSLSSSPVPPYGLLTKHPNTNISDLKCISSGSPGPRNDKCAATLPPEMHNDAPPPCKIAKRNYADEQGNPKAWLQIAGATPTQPPWRVEIGKAQSSPLLQMVKEPQQTFSKRSNSATIGTQTLLSTKTENAVTNQHHQRQRQHILYERQRQLQRYRQLLTNPVVLQAILFSGRLMAPAAQVPTNNAANSRKRNFVGKLLSNGGFLSNQLAKQENVQDAGGTANLPGAGFLELPSALVELTNTDCEVNAPLTQPLLDGPDIITALDSGIPMDTGADCMLF